MYKSLHDVTSYSNISSNKRAFVRKCVPSSAYIKTQGSDKINPTVDPKVKIRPDGRLLDETRPIKLSFKRAHNLAQCLVEICGISNIRTRVFCTVSSSLIYSGSSDFMNEGAVIFHVDSRPLCNMGFDYAPSVSNSEEKKIQTDQNTSQKSLFHRILRNLEKAILTSGALDTESLCVHNANCSWHVDVNVVIIDHSGNVMDACLISVLGALKHYRLPFIQVIDYENELISSNSEDRKKKYRILHCDEREPTYLALYHTPLSTTFALFASNHYQSKSNASVRIPFVTALVDPLLCEERIQDGTITLVFDNSKVCAVDFPGGCEVGISQLKECMELAKIRCQEVKTVLELALLNANDRDKCQRLKRIKMRKIGQGNTHVNDVVTFLFSKEKGNISFLKQMDHKNHHHILDLNINYSIKVNRIPLKLADMVKLDSERDLIINMNDNNFETIRRNLPKKNVCGTLSSDVCMSLSWAPFTNTMRDSHFESAQQRHKLLISLSRCLVGDLQLWQSSLKFVTFPNELKQINDSKSMTMISHYCDTNIIFSSSTDSKKTKNVDTLSVSNMVSNPVTQNGNINVNNRKKETFAKNLTHLNSTDNYLNNNFRSNHTSKKKYSYQADFMKNYYIKEMGQNHKHIPCKVNAGVCKDIEMIDYFSVNNLKEKQDNVRIYNELMKEAKIERLFWENNRNLNHNVKVISTTYRNSRYRCPDEGKGRGDIQDLIYLSTPITNNRAKKNKNKNKNKNK